MNYRSKLRNSVTKLVECINGSIPVNEVTPIAKKKKKNLKITFKRWLCLVLKDGF